MLLPPGGFLVLGFLLAGKRLLDSRLQRRQRVANVADTGTEPASATG